MCNSLSELEVRPTDGSVPDVTLFSSSRARYSEREQKQVSSWTTPHVTFMSEEKTGSTSPPALQKLHFANEKTTEKRDVWI